jgi:guanine deaminase
VALDCLPDDPVLRSSAGIMARAPGAGHPMYAAAVLLPGQPPFTLRARVLSPLADGSTLWEPDGVVAVGADGRLGRVGPAAGFVGPEAPLDVRPLVIMPGLVDCHVHLPQIPSAGLGAGMHLLDWLERHVFSLERAFDVAAAERLAPLAFRAMAAAGTTAFAGYCAIWADSTDACFRAALAHGIRATLGMVMMDRLTYDDVTPPERILEDSLRGSADLADRWHGADGGRLRYAFTPRFAVSCSADMLRESAALAGHHGATWQTHVSEDDAEMARVAELFPEALDYLDVYDRAGGLGPRALLAHAIHLSDREVGRLAESGAAVAHCPVSNMFLASGVMPLARYREAGIPVGLGSDVAGAPDLSILTQMREGFYQHSSRAAAQREAGAQERAAAPPGPLDWLRLGTLDGARALGLQDVIGSLEPGKEADLIAVDASLTEPPGAEPATDIEALVSRLIFRERPGMVRGAWVRGRRLEGAPPGPDGVAA